MAGPNERDTDRDDAATPSPSGMSPRVVRPLSEADPSTSPKWDEHVDGYFNADAHPGEAQPTASHEAKK